MWVCLRATVSLLSCTSSPWLRWEAGPPTLRRNRSNRETTCSNACSLGSLRPGRIEVGLVHAFGEKAGKSPVRHCLGDVAHGPATFFPSEMNVGLGVAVEFAGTSATNVVGQPGKAHQLVVPEAVHLPTPISGGKLLKTGDFRLFEVLPQHPGCVDLCVGQPIGTQHPRYILIGVPPMPNRNGQSGEDEVAGVASAGTGCTGLVKVTQIHGGPEPSGTKKKASGPWSLGLQRARRVSTHFAGLGVNPLWRSRCWLSGSRNESRYQCRGGRWTPGWNRSHCPPMLPQTLAGAVEAHGLHQQADRQHRLSSANAGPTESAFVRSGTCCS